MPSPSIKDEKLYRDLRKQGDSEGEIRPDRQRRRCARAFHRRQIRR